jgi:hypothetical protein
LNKDFHSCYHLLDPSQSFEITYGNSSAPAQAVLKACTHNEIKAEYKPGGESPAFFQIEKDRDMALLKVPSFGIRNMEAYLALLDSAFIRMDRDRISRLVVDLRDNEGGHPIFAAQLLSYLTAGEFTYFQRNNEACEFEPLYNPMQANAHHFKGKLYVLVNGSCLSTTGHLISLISYHTEAKFIGEEPGSTYLCNDKSIQIQLPHSGLEVNIPRSTFVSDVTGFNDSIPFPLDYPVDMSVEDLLAGRDPCFDYLTTFISDK